LFERLTGEARRTVAQKHRVLVLYRQSLFTQCIQNLLETAGDFEVSGVDLDLEDPVVSLRAFNPDTVVVGANDLCTASKDLLMHLLRESPSVQIVCLTTLDGGVDLYRHEQMPLTRGADLLKALRVV
jgi:chemotaxis response regulator CheB